MQWKIGAWCIGGALLVFSTMIASGAEQPHWGYAGNVGSEHWGALAPAHVRCASGRNQSPIDLKSFVAADRRVPSGLPAALGEAAQPHSA
jgi:carbonic anhydrase